MCKVIDLGIFRASRQIVPSIAELPNVFNIIEYANETLLDDWHKMSSKNSLNDYFISALPNIIDHKKRVYYISNLNEVSAIEIAIGHRPIVYCPGTLRETQTGWMTRFKLGTHRVTSPEFLNEGSARCFSILLYIKLKRDFINNALM